MEVLVATPDHDHHVGLTFNTTDATGYYLEVRSRETAAIHGYAFTVRRLGRIDQGRIDHGDDRTGATVLPPSQAVRGNIQPGGDVDFFTFETEADQIAIVTLDYNIIGGMVLRVHDAEGRIIAEDSDWGSTREGQPFDFSQDEQIVRRLPASWHLLRLCPQHSLQSPWLLPTFTRTRTPFRIPRPCSCRRPNRERFTISNVIRRTGRLPTIGDSYRCRRTNPIHDPRTHGHQHV